MNSHPDLANASIEWAPAPQPATRAFAARTLASICYDPALGTGRNKPFAASLGDSPADGFLPYTPPAIRELIRTQGVPRVVLPRQAPAGDIAGQRSATREAIATGLSAKEEAIGLLKLAAEVEHALMVQYLYAYASIKGEARRAQIFSIP